MTNNCKIVRNSYYKNFFISIFKKPAFFLSTFVLLVIFFSGLYIDLFCSKDLYSIINFDNSFISPNKTYIFGTNDLGQNLFYLILLGSFNTIKLATLVSVINVLLGIIFGIIWGHNSKIDGIMIFIKNIFDNIPIIYFYIIIISALGNGIIPLLIVLTLFGWLNMACLIRNNLIIIRNKDYNKYSSIIKTPLSKIAIYNYLPALLPVIFNSVALSIPEVTSLEITLSYFGFSLGEENISLGKLLYSSISNNNCFSHPYLFIIPLLFVFIINLCYYYIGKAVSDAAAREGLSCSK